VPGLQRLDHVELVAVANRSRQSSERAATEWGIPNSCDQWQDVVARHDIDAVFIGTWPYMHCQVALAALEAGKHVFTQARMAMDAAEARAMAEKARETNLVAMVCPVPIGLSVDKVVARILRENILGDIRLVRVQSFSDAYAEPDVPMNWRKDHRLSGLNMHTLGMYIEVIHRWFGPTQTVSAQADTFVTERTDDRRARIAVRIPDQFLITGRLTRGTPVQYTISAAVHHGADTIEIYGSHASLRYDVAADRLNMALPGTSFEPVQPRNDEVVELQPWSVERDFIRAIREGGDYHPNFDDGLRYMEVIQAVYDSAATARQVSLL
jgi:predicted dehydrogenase